ncbi:MAG: hypothetical protein R2849_00895 [Thermomicrobiales bacterium]
MRSSTGAGRRTRKRERGLTPPVFIVVCNNTNVSKLVYDYIAGWERETPDGSTVVVPAATDSATSMATVGRHGHDRLTASNSNPASMSPAFKREASGDRAVQGRAGTLRPHASDLTDEDSCER